MKQLVKMILFYDDGSFDEAVVSTNSKAPIGLGPIKREPTGPVNIPVAPRNCSKCGIDLNMPHTGCWQIGCPSGRGGIPYQPAVID